MGKVKRKNWTLREDALIAQAIKEHPDNPHQEFKTVAELTGRSIGSVRGRYQRVYINTGLREKKRRGKNVVEVKKEPVVVKKEQKKKKLNAIQRFVKRLFNI